MKPVVKVFLWVLGIGLLLSAAQNPDAAQADVTALMDGIRNIAEAVRGVVSALLNGDGG